MHGSSRYKLLQWPTLQRVLCEVLQNCNRLSSSTKVSGPLFVTAYIASAVPSRVTPDDLDEYDSWSESSIALE